MVSPGTVSLVRRLLAAGNLSQRQIAESAGVSRTSVAKIAAGHEMFCHRRRFLDAGGENLPIGPPERCRGCGGLVFPPCRLCRVRSWIARRRLRRLA